MDITLQTPFDKRYVKLGSRKERKLRRLLIEHDRTDVSNLSKHHEATHDSIYALLKADTDYDTEHQALNALDDGKR